MRKTIITIEYVEKSTRFANCPNTAIIKIWQGVFSLLVNKKDKHNPNWTIPNPIITRNSVLLKLFINSSKSFIFK